MSWRVDALLAGKAREFRGDETSAIGKHPIEGNVEINAEGLVPDEQADRSVHGGPEMAVHLYPLDHHHFWRRELGGHNLLDEPGAFGSNLAVSGLDEGQIQIGDQFRLGTAILEVSQPRQPCWKIEHRFGEKGMVAKIIETGRSGWYFRVLVEGQAQAGDLLEPVKSGHAGWNVLRVFRALFGPKPDASELEAIAALTQLSPKQREKALKRLG